MAGGGAGGGYELISEKEKFLLGGEIELRFGMLQ